MNSLGECKEKYSFFDRIAEIGLFFGFSTDYTSCNSTAYTVYVENCVENVEKSCGNMSEFNCTSKIPGGKPDCGELFKALSV